MTPATLSTFGRDLLRPVITLVSPGALLLAPYVQRLLTSSRELNDFVVQHVTASVVAFLLAAVSVGLLLENVGAIIESECWDRLLRRRDCRLHKRNDGFDVDWHKYWLLAFPTSEEPVGQHYIRTMVIQMKGEVGFALAILGAMYGAARVGASANIAGKWIALGVLLSTGLVAYLGYESYSSARTLADVRRELVLAYGTPRPRRAKARPTRPR